MYNTMYSDIFLDMLSTMPCLLKVFLRNSPGSWGA